MAIIESTMKTFRYLIIIFTSLFLVSCKGDKDDIKAIDITGEWELIDFETKSITIGDQTIEVFFAFKEDQTFELRQKLGEGRFREYSGNWKLEGTQLSGNYSDGKSWGSSYQVSLENDMLQMTPELNSTDTNSYPTETYIYRKVR